PAGVKLDAGLIVGAAIEMGCPFCAGHPATVLKLPVHDERVIFLRLDAGSLGTAIQLETLVILAVAVARNRGVADGTEL
ncbi:hypothetical protein ACFL6C_13590, partial [Myxococcota bacterium]